MSGMINVLLILPKKQISHLYTHFVFFFSKFKYFLINLNFIPGRLHLVKKQTYFFNIHNDQEFKLFISGAIECIF